MKSSVVNVDLMGKRRMKKKKKKACKKIRTLVFSMV